MFKRLKGEFPIGALHLSERLAGRFPCAVWLDMCTGNARFLFKTFKNGDQFPPLLISRSIRDESENILTFKSLGAE
jgi:hypothetical protein